MPKETIGGVEIRWARGAKDETIDIVIPGEYLFLTGGHLLGGEPEYMKKLRERGYKIVVTPEQASQFAKVLQKAVRQIEEPYPEAHDCKCGVDVKGWFVPLMEKHGIDWNFSKPFEYWIDQIPAKKPLTDDARAKDIAETIQIHEEWFPKEDK